MNNYIAAIKVTNLTKVYHIYDKPQDRLKEALHPFKKKYHHDFYALNDVSFEVKKGDTLGIIGKNGAGKSTLLKMITGVLTQTSGTIEVNGKIASLLELGAGFNPEMSGVENIYLNGTLMGFTKEEMGERLDAILEFADIGEFIYQPVKTYSSGMFARLAFSVAINVEPDILIVDEALSVGDVFFQQKCNIFMKENMMNVTKLIVTHDLATLASMTNKAILIEDGHKITEGKPIDVIEVYQKSLHDKLFGRHQVKFDETANDLRDYPIGDYHDIDKNNLAGSLEVSIDKYLLKVNKDVFIEGVVFPNDAIYINFIISTNKDINYLIIGYIIKDKYGTSIFGENSKTSKTILPEIKSGQKYKIQLKFNWPEVQKGDYFLTLGIGNGMDSMIHEIVCWAHNIIKITSVLKLDTTVHCIFNNKIDEIEIRKI